MPRFSETVMEHFQSPRNEDRMDGPDRVGVSGIPGRGRHVVLYLKVNQDRVERAMFQCHGCGATIACGSMVTELVRDRVLAECLRLTADDIVRALDGLPRDKQHSANMAITALQDALTD